MKLTRVQKKFLRKNLKKLSLKEIAQETGVTKDSLSQYLKSIWNREKYDKFLSKQVQVKESFGFKDFLKQKIRIFAFLSFLVFAVYVNSLGNDFVSDDITAIVKNKNIGNLSFYLRYQPLNSLRHSLYFLIYKVWGLNPLFFHLLGVLFHLGTVLTIYILLSFLYTPFLGLITALLFSVHPILSETVVWISGNTHAQYTFFALLSFLFYVLARSRDWFKKYYLISLICFLLALLTTEKSAIFALIILFFEISRGKLSKNWKKTLPFFILSGIWAFFIFSGSVLSKRMIALESQHYQEGGLHNPLTQIPTSLASYLQLIFWPNKLTLYHSEMVFSKLQFLLMALATIILLGAIIYSFINKKYRFYFFWLSFFIIALLPMLTPFKIAWLVAERYVYLGSLGIFVVVAKGIEKLVKMKSFKKPIYVLFALIIVVFSIITIRRNMDWKNQDSLWLAAAKTSPLSSQNHNNLGDLYGRRGDFERAAEEFKRAIELKPGYADAYHNLANIYQQVGKREEAIENYQKAFQFNPNLWQSHLNLAAIYHSENNIEKVKQELEMVLKINPDNEQAQQALLMISK